MKKYIAVTALSLSLILLSQLVGCSNVGNPSDDLSTSTPNSTENSSNDMSSTADETSSGNGTSTVENIQPDGEPTFLTAPDGTPIYTSEITEIYTGNEESGNKKTITLADAEQSTRSGSGYFTVKCDGFVYGYIPERALNYIDNPEMFKQQGNDGKYFDYLGEEFDINTGEGKYSTEYMRINVGDKFGSLTVKKAYTLFARPTEMNSFSDVPGAYISDCCVEFDGEIELTGYVNITPIDTFYGEGGDMEFFPDGDSSVKIPGFSYFTNSKTGEICHFSGSYLNGTYGSGSSSLGNMFKIDCDTSSLHPGDYFVKVKVMLDNVRYVPGDFGGLKVELKAIELI